MKSWLLALLPFVAFSQVAQTNDLDVARSALRDGFWGIARQYASGATNDQARAIVLESYAIEGKWDKVKEALDGWSGSQGRFYDYYRAVLNGDYGKATALLRQTGNQSAAVEADMLEASQQAMAGKTDEARAIWKKVVSSTNASERAYAIASINLGEVSSLSNAYWRTNNKSLRQSVGMHLGMALLKRPGAESEGERIIRKIAMHSPDAEGAMTAFIALVDSMISRRDMKNAEITLHQLVEIWPDAAKSSRVNADRGWIYDWNGQRELALEAFEKAATLASDNETKALAMLKVGDVLSELGRNDESMAKYREILKAYPKTTASQRLKSVVDIRELEAKGREAYRQLRFSEAQKAFAEVAAKDQSRKSRMDYFTMLCLFGQGLDSEAHRKAVEVIADADEPGVKSAAMLWFAKFLYNRGEWKASRQFFTEYAELSRDRDSAAANEAMLWASRASFEDGNFTNAIDVVSRLVGNDVAPEIRAKALLVQGEALIELARFDEAVLVLERVVAGERGMEEERMRAKMLSADALFAMGADNPSRYAAALEAYRTLRLNGTLGVSEQLVIDYKIGKALEKLKRAEDAEKQFYSQVVLVYARARKQGQIMDDDAKAAFSKAALWLVDENESRGKDFQAVHVLEIIAASDVPAAVEAAKRLEKKNNTKKGGLL